MKSYSVIINVADLKNPEDPQGRSYREINREKLHKIPLKSLIELENGARAFVIKHTRDCDETPLYSLALDPDDFGLGIAHGYPEESLKKVNRNCDQ